MTTQEKINNIVSNRKVLNVFANLWGRWQDEKEYEDINDYGKVMFDVLQKNCPNVQTTFLKVTKRPLGIQVIMDNRKWHIYVTGREFGVKPIQ